MNKRFDDRDTPGQLGNGFPGGGILMSLGRLVFHLVLTASLLVVLGTITLVDFLETTNEPDAD